jgi:hypothetical protein
MHLPHRQTFFFSQKREELPRFQWIPQCGGKVWDCGNIFLDAVGGMMLERGANWVRSLFDVLSGTGVGQAA